MPRWPIAILCVLALSCVSVPPRFPFRACLKEPARLNALLPEHVIVTGETDDDRYLVLFIDRTGDAFKKPFPVDKDAVLLICKGLSLDVQEPAPAGHSADAGL